MGATYRFRSNIRIVTFPTAGTYRDAYQKHAHNLRVKMRKVTIKSYLISHVRLKVLISRHIHAHTPVLQSGRGDLIRSTWYGRNYDVRNRKAPGKVKRGRYGAHNVMRVVRAARCC
jgi:hypothetical protein